MKCKKGFKKVRGKCKKVSRAFSKNKSKKSYNPFKMKGSWIGFALFAFIGIGFCMTIGPFGSCGSFWEEFGEGLTSSHGWMKGAILGSIGFLFGWGSHSSIRAFYKFKSKRNKKLWIKILLYTMFSVTLFMILAILTFMCAVVVN